MMKTMRPGASRRAWLVGGLACVAGLSAATTTARAAKAAKEDFLYQPKPKGKASCASCRLYQSTSTSDGVCAVVEGPISPNGWCMAYSPKE